MNRQAFLEARRAGIGSSDVAPILGVSPWSNALDVYLEKVNPVEASLKPMAAPLEWGIRCEPVIAAAVMDHYGWALRKGETTKHPEHPFLIASPDRMTEAGEVVEIKTARTDHGWGEAETAEIPGHYWLQVQHQLAVMDAETAFVFVLVGNCDFRRYRVGRDETYLAEFLEPLREFWSMVEARTPPEPDFWHPGTLDTLNRLYRPLAGKRVDLSDMAPVVDQYVSLGQQIKAMEDQRDAAKAQLIAALGEAELGELPDGRAVTRKVIDRKEYTAKATSYVDMRIKNPTKKGKVRSE